MTKKQLRIQVFLVITYLCALVLLAYVGKFFYEEALYSTIKDFSSFFIAAAAAYLSYCFSRRQAQITSLRELWKQAVLSKGELIQYTHLDEFSKKSFGATHNSISTTIDLVRSVYKNVGESDNNVGLFPFEPLHDMRISLQNIGFSDVTPEKCIAERKNIINAWNAFRYEFLKEFQTPEPPHPITTRGACDKRRRK